MVKGPGRHYLSRFPAGSGRLRLTLSKHKRPALSKRKRPLVPRSRSIHVQKKTFYSPEIEVDLVKLIL